MSECAFVGEARNKAFAHLKARRQGAAPIRDVKAGEVIIGGGPYFE